MKRFLVILLYVLTFSKAVYGQQLPTDDPVADAKLHLGVFGVDPRVGLTNAGVDTNVFNSVDNPQSDFTFTVTPETDVYMRTGRGLLSISGGLELVYFQEFESERSVNSNAIGQYEFRFNRMRPYASARTLNTRERPGYEIDVRARHYESDFHIGSDFRFMSKGTARVDVRHLDYRFAGDEVFNGSALREELNRTLRSLEFSWRQRLTALTTWITRVSRETERFEFEDLRNSDSFRFSSGFELGRFALIRGSAYAGFRKLTPADGGILPAYTGITADVNVSYTAPSQTRIGARVRRDLEYSYESATPYYVQTGWTGTLTQRVTGRWDLQVSGGRDRLAYHALVREFAREDQVVRFGGGIGYALGDEVRAGFDVTSYDRRSIDPRREYGGVRAGVSVTYGY